ncbi:MAG: aminotransferase class V-fold PLP-dependent enzyme [Planctomycetes bacterium]|nr:aminotransferase class V-fold PLP-dependent enzyme [Planctomycetota bacterium]
MTPRVLDLDHDATTPVDPRVLARFLEVEREAPGNPGSVHALGRRARAALEEARAELADALRIPTDAVVFLASGTEANHLAVRGLGDPRLPLLASAVEHKSVLAAASERGLREWGLDRCGRAVVRPVEGRVGMLALAQAQGELGSVQPVAAAAALARELGVPLHVDAAQSLGRIQHELVLRDADTVAISAHKLGGLRGGSALLVLRARPRPLLRGGGQEGGLRAGTASPSLAAATARAVALAVGELASRATAMAAARDAFLAELRALVDCAPLVPPAECLPNTTMLCFDGVDGRALVLALDLAGVLASQGAACSSGSPEPPAVLRAMGLGELESRRCVRFSTAASTTVDDAREAAQRVARVVLALRAHATRPRAR